MERADREKWVEEHYADLVREAKMRRYANQEDVVQTTAMRLLDSETFGDDLAPWPFAVSAMRSVAATERRSVGRQERVKADYRRQTTSGNFRSNATGKWGSDGKEIPLKTQLPVRP